MKSRRQSLLKMAVTGAIALGLLCGGQPTWAGSSAFSRIVVFGDSLSDMGRFHALSGGAPPAPYWQGHFSNGKIWVEYLAAYLDMPLSLESNYAVGGATTGEANFRNGFAGKTYPGVAQQITSFLQNPPPQIEDALFIYWAGANDFFLMLETGGTPQALIGNGVINTVVEVQALYSAGARHIVVVNIPDLGVTPLARAYGIGPQLTALCIAYNQALDGALDSMEAAGIHTIRVDAFKCLNNMATTPEAYGFINTTTPAIGSGNPSDRCLFWDDVHPTTMGHQQMALDALVTIIKDFSPRQGHKTPIASANGLKGLVK